MKRGWTAIDKAGRYWLYGPVGGYSWEAQVYCVTLGEWTALRHRTVTNCSYQQESQTFETLWSAAQWCLE